MYSTYMSLKTLLTKCIFEASKNIKILGLCEKYLACKWKSHKILKF